ncbi:hypothetical protein GQ457_10G023820 [Hibiscus cannabinus]
MTGMTNGKSQRRRVLGHFCKARDVFSEIHSDISEENAENVKLVSLYVEKDIDRSVVPGHAKPLQSKAPESHYAHDSNPGPQGARDSRMSNDEREINIRLACRFLFLVTHPTIKMVARVPQPTMEVATI